MSIRGNAANPISAENALAGNPSSEWDVRGIGDPTIQGFATDISVNRGTSVAFKINTTAAAYRIDIYRIGYYSGRGARKVATITPSATLPQIQPTFLREHSTGLVDCGNWGVSATWAVPADATSGVYIARPVRTDTGGASHIIFIVRDDAGASDFLFQTSDTTWQAYNNYGGVNLYRGNGPANDVGVGRAYKVSYNRPFNNRAGNSAAERESFLFNSEYPMIRWMEANGYDVSYATGIDTDRRGVAALKTHKVFLSVGHDEYWSGQQRTNIEAARAAGVHLGFFSANEIYWKTRWENSIASPVTSYRTLVCYKETHANAKIDPSPSWTGTWRDARFSPPSDGGRPENSVTGQLFTVDAFRYDPIFISANEGKLRFWRNTSIATLADGQRAQLPAGVLGFEWDEVIDNGLLPQGLFRLSTTSIAVGRRLADSGTGYSAGVATHSLTLYRHASGALVFGAGTIQWPWGLDATHDFTGPPADLRMQQATLNLFADMGAQPATLQAGLIPATESTDLIPPTSIIQPPPDGVVKLGSTVTTNGTAADNGGGRTVGVEFSSDGGLTWRPATGTTNWSVTWTLNKLGPITLKSRATDDSGRTERPGPGITINPRGPSILVNGSFESDFAGWSVAGNQSLASGAPYVASTGTKLAIFNSANSTPNGVISQSFATAVGQTYTLEFDPGVLAYNYDSQKMLVTVTGTSDVLSKTVTIGGGGGGLPRWAPQSHTFIANSTTSTLAFRDQSTSTAGLDMTLDDVWVGGPASSVNTPPVAVSDSYVAFKNTALVIPSPGILTNDTDAQSNLLTAVLDTNPATGTLVLNPNGSFTYTPANDFTGTASFTYRARDGSLNSNPVTVTISVSPPPSGSLVNGSFESNFNNWTQTGNVTLMTAPVYVPSNGSKLAAFNTAQSDPGGILSQSFVTTPGQSYKLEFDAGVFAYNLDPQIVAVTVTGSTSLISQTITINGLGGGATRWVPQTFNFVANSGVTTLTFRDRSTTSNGLDLLLDNIRINGSAANPNTAPVATGDFYTTVQNTPLTVLTPGVLANDTDAQSTPLTAVLTVGPTRGGLTLSPNGSFTYTPTSGVTGNDSFTYRARDESLDSNIVTVQITISLPGAGGLSNGSFESNFTGWTQTGNAGILTAAPYVPTNGSKLVAFNANESPPNGVLSQSLATTAGQTYTLQFDAGVIAYNFNSQAMLVTATGNSNLLSKTITLNGLGDGVTRWAPQIFTFVANSALTTITFQDMSTTSSALDLLLDHVRITGLFGSLISEPPPTGTGTLETLPTPSIAGIPGDISIQMNPPRAGSYILESSTDLVNWQWVATLVSDGQTLLDFHDRQSPLPETPPSPQLFYRIALQPVVPQN